jgi:3-hydroxybutyryl-CoA dehydrogenase
MEIRNVFVAGAGFMGNGIAQMAALAGYSVTLYDLQEACLQAGMGEVRRSLGKLLSRGKVNREQYDASLANLETTTRLEDAARADLAVEAIPEDRELKKEVFSRLDAICPPHAILATNTSAIPISSIAAATSRPDRVVGTHFFGPVPLMRLCEIIAGVLTSRDTMDAADTWARSLGKETVRVSRDTAGFIANRVTIPASLEAVRLVEAGEASIVEVDRISSMGNPSGAGTLSIMDNAGLDVSLAAALAIYEDTADPRFFPPPLLRRMVEAGLRGRKSGRGFYDYGSGEKKVCELIGTETAVDEMEEASARPSLVLNRIFLPMLIESICLLEAKVTNASDIDKAVRLGFNFPLGPLEIADSMGLDTVLEAGEFLREETGDPGFDPPPLLRRMVRGGLLGRKTGRGFYVYEEVGA